MKVEVRLTCFDEKELEEILTFLKDREPNGNTEQKELPPESVCSKCGNDVTSKVEEYSKNKYGKVLCYKCQQKEKDE